ncbi:MULTISPECIES: PIN domain-containing protein [unclassified Kitasatospora]|uniref:PIN domain-containing protein n=1 Tax=unclassified Kitasatospora TaxID=2633591 RepID=UPI00070C03A7|nr:MULTISPECIES: PIN domain-containing protein [unclassified Kitasatospora]KQV20543.1 hypothetical protein ASC99_21015 [Kitasatospora sp. Root107]KRB69126.1 hypothetical protein ASE03_28590 [Kitasatospora sp. Root187]
MQLTLRPGIDRDYLLSALRKVREDVSNLYTSGPHTAPERLISYLEWADDAAGKLAPLISANDIDSLIFTRRYEQIFNKLEILASPDTVRLANNMVSIELKQRSDDLTAVVDALHHAITTRVQPILGVVFDTSMFIKHPVKLELIDFRELTGVDSGTVNLIVPMVVIDELDKLKESKDRNQRWRAGYSVAVIDRLFPSGRRSFAVLRHPEPSVGEGWHSHPQVIVEIVFDPPGHVRLPIADDEIIDRALAIQPLAASPMKLFTYDTGQSTRARNAGLNVEKLAIPIGDEPG